jgi:HAD superfamily hydrolase (TIGR01509 family)
MMRAVVCDLDGLLIDSEHWSWQAHNTVLQRLGLPPLALHEVQALVGLDSDAEWRALGRMRAVSIAHAAYRHVQGDEFRRTRDAYHTPMPGVHALLDLLERSGIPVAVASNSRRSSIEEALAALDIARHFTAVISIEDVTHGKPDPEIYRRAVQALAVPPDAAIALEDSSVGVQAARAAGLFVIAVPNALTAQQDFTQAHRQATSLNEVRHWLSTVPLLAEPAASPIRDQLPTSRLGSARPSHTPPDGLGESVGDS